MRRGTLIAIVALFVLLIAAAIYQAILGRGPNRYPGPGAGSSPVPAATASSPPP